MAAEPTSQQEGNTENPKSNAERIISVISSLSEKDIEKAGNALRFVNKVRTENEVSSDTSVDTINIDPEGLCDVLEMTADFVPEQSTIEEGLRTSLEEGNLIELFEGIRGLGNIPDNLPRIASVNGDSGNISFESPFELGDGKTLWIAHPMSTVTIDDMRTAMMDIEDFGKLLASLIKEGNCVRNELCGIKSNPVDPSTIPTDNSYESLKKRYALKHPFPRTKIEQDYGFIIQFFNENCHKKDSSLYIYDPISGENASLKEILRDSYVRPFLEIPDGLFDKEDADPFADLDKLLGNPQ